jgi:hypothetical protein
MQPPFQQSVASAHIDDLMRAAQSYRLAPRPRRNNAAARGFEAVRAAFAARPQARKPQHA